MAERRTKLAIVRERYEARGGPERFIAGVLPALDTGMGSRPPSRSILFSWSNRSIFA